MEEYYKDLSKIKKIYLTYRNGNEVHVEKRTVIYINKTYVYFKTNGSDELDKLRLCLLFEKIDSIPKGRYWTKYSIEEPDRELLKELSLKSRKSELEQSVEVLRESVRILEEKLEKEKKILLSMENTLVKREEGLLE